jgi:hypothetical protein
MTAAGWVLLVVSLATVYGVAAWCYWRLLFDRSDD